MARLLLAALLAWVSVTGAAAQDHDMPGMDHGMHHDAAPADQEGAGSGWNWSLDAKATIGFNDQERKFRDFRTWESQNWLMAMGSRPVGRGSLQLSSMWSFEPFTMKAIGSPQVFQTGETFRTAPLIDYQHPHDLIMGLGGDYRHTVGRASVYAGLDLVGAPTIGPVAFMHRASAAENPQAPLSHHYADSTHITHGVVRGGIGAGGWTLESSWFHGREPDEHRKDLDLGRLDSWAARLGWARGGWAAQVSGAALTLPEATTPYDARRVTASVAWSSGGETPRVAWTAIAGQNREIHGNLEAYLFEATVRPTTRAAVYMRAESVAKDILDAGFHPRGVFHRHRQSQVGAITGGYVHDLLRLHGTPVGLGADVTGYVVPANLRDSYGSPVSFHVFVRTRLGWRSGGAAPGDTAGHQHAH